MFKDKLKEEQRVIYSTLLNSFKDNHSSHAYLVSGEKGSSVKDVAMFIAKSFLCDNDILACEKCNTCRRVENKSYIDFKFINENEESILKDDIEELQKDFSMTALEEKGIKVYIIHLIEKANAVAVNKLLKFLEEPSDDIIGIITTNNISKVLPTIISRCQLIRVINPSKDELINNIKLLGYKDDDSFILSRFYNSIDEIKNIDKEEYDNIKALSFKTLEILLNSPKDCLYFVESNIINTIKDKELLTIYLEIIQIALRDLILNRQDNICPREIENVNNLDLEKILSLLILNIGKINLNINTSLLIDKLFYQIVYENKEDK